MMPQLLAGSLHNHRNTLDRHLHLERKIMYPPPFSSWYLFQLSAHMHFTRVKCCYPFINTQPQSKPLAESVETVPETHQDNVITKCSRKQLKESRLFYFIWMISDDVLNKSGITEDQRLFVRFSTWAHRLSSFSARVPVRSDGPRRSRSVRARTGRFILF